MREDLPSDVWRVPGYEEIRELGAGAQGRVVLARKVFSGQVVAIKYLDRRILHDPQAVNVFRREAAMLARVSNPHVARFLEYVETPQGVAIIMEAVHGRSLRTLLTEHGGPLAPEAALVLLKGSLLGLDATHRVGVVHRDYKPANVMVGDDGVSKLIDFGVAVLAGQAGAAGTPLYMAPEQWAGEPASPATDIYAATCVFVECITGAPPFGRATMGELRARHLSAPITLDAVPEPLHPLVLHGMAKRPGKRPGNARAFLAALEEAAQTACGPDWEHRGIRAMAAAAAGVAASFPLTLLVGSHLVGGSATGTAGAGAAAGVTGQNATAHAMAQATGSGSGQGLLAKAGGSKVAAMLGGAGAAAIVAGVLLWPSGPEVGGESHGRLRAYFTRPGALLGQPNMPAAETPYMDLQFTLAPARALPGEKIRMTIRFEATMPNGVKYLPDGSRQCFGPNSRRRDTNNVYEFYIGNHSENESGDALGRLALYRVFPSREKQWPTPDQPNIILTGNRRVRDETSSYLQSVCGYRDAWTEIREVTLTNSPKIGNGRYLVSPAIPPRITSIRRNNVEVAPESVGAKLEGDLPELQILEG